MIRTFQTDDWDEYRMDYKHPFQELEPLDEEIRVVGEALKALCAADILAHTEYDGKRMLAHRRAVAENFDIPWTAISPRMQRLLYSINAIAEPGNMIAAGIFCGNTFISNAGAAVGPGACYQASQLIGIEIRTEEAERAERNVRKVDPTGVARIVAADAVDFVREYPDEIDLIYLDADGAGGRGKRIYLDILEAAYDKIPPGGIVLAHNSVNGGEPLRQYLAFVRNSKNFNASVNVILDPEGLEVSCK